MKPKIILFVFNTFLLTFVFSQSQMIKGTVVPVSGKQGIVFLPVAEKVPVTERVTALDTVPKQIKISSIVPVPVDITKVNKNTIGIARRMFTANYSLQSLDTVLMAKSANAVSLPVKSNLKGQIVSGVILSQPGRSTVFEPLAFIAKSVSVNEPAPSITHVTNTPVTSVSPVKPMDLLDTSKLDKKDFEEAYSTPQAKSEWVSQNIKGVLSSANGSSSRIEPVSPLSLGMTEAESLNKGELKSPYTTPDGNIDVSKPAAGQAAGRFFYLVKNIQPVVSPMDLLDTTETRRRDYISSYSTPPVSINLKAQNITGTIVSARGVFTVIEPISADSLLAQESAQNNKLQMNSPGTGSETGTALQPNIVASPSPSVQNNISFPIRNAYSPIPEGEIKKSVAIVRSSSVSNARKSTDLASKQKNSGSRNIIPAVSHAELTNKTVQDNDTKYNFFVNQFGKFSIRISSNYFYLNITQNGKLTDYAILDDGQTAGSNSHTTQLGKLKITFDKRGWIETIAGYELAYTYDGRVNKVGNIYINYDAEGKIIKVGTVDINFNYNSTVDKFANYRVGYIRRRVIGIDDSNGLVIYRPVVEEDNKSNF